LHSDQLTAPATGKLALLFQNNRSLQAVAVWSLTAIRPLGTDHARLQHTAKGAAIAVGKAIRPIMARPISSSYRATGPVLGSKKRRDMRRLGTVVLVLMAAGGAAWLSLRVVAQDLAAGKHIHAQHADDAKAKAAEVHAATGVAAALQPGGPAAAAVPVPTSAAIALDPVAQALLAAGRDHLARKVSASSLPVDDSRANKGSGMDLIDRGLERILSLRQALPRHRARAPQLYGLRERQPPTADERRRALTAENLQIFLAAFAQQLDGAHDNLEAGDILLIERKHGAKRLMPAVVSDVVDGDGVPMIITMDPVDRVAREQPLVTYVLHAHFRLHLAEIERMRVSLDMPLQQLGGTAL
jgi:hypothetical protein